MHHEARPVPRLQRCLVALALCAGCQGLVIEPGASGETPVGPDGTGPTGRPGSPGNDPNDPGEDVPVGPGGVYDEIPPEAPYVPPSFECDPTAPAVTASRLWRINARQYEANVKRAITAHYNSNRNGANPPRDIPRYPAPFDWANDADRYSTQSRSYLMSSEDFAAAREAADILAPYFAARTLVTGPQCADLSGTERDDCVRRIFEVTGHALFRRASFDGELERSMQIYRAASTHLAGIEDGFRYQLMSPSFLFHDLSQGPQTYEEYAIYVNSILEDDPTPDRLTRTIEREDVVTPPTDRSLMEEYALERIGDMEGEKYRQFFDEYAEVDFMFLLAKDQERIGFTYDPGRLYQTWGGRDGYISHLISNYADRGLFTELMLGTWHGSNFRMDVHLYADGSGDVGRDDNLVDLPERPGFMASPAVMVAKSHTEETDPMERGRYFIETLFCADIPDIPIGVVAQLPPAEGRTMRQRIEEDHSGGECQACHKYIDPAGLAFELFDDVGRFRTMENGQPIQVAATFIAPGGESQEFSTLEELMRIVESSREARECFVLQNFQFWMGRRAQEGDACTVASMYDALYRDGSYKKMLATMLVESAMQSVILPGDE